MNKVRGRYWHYRQNQWVNIGFPTMEDAEEWMTRTAITLYNLHTKE